jgi:hypothetical protein
LLKIFLAEILLKLACCYEDYKAWLSDFEVLDFSEKKTYSLVYNMCKVYSASDFFETFLCLWPGISPETYIFNFVATVRCPLRTPVSSDRYSLIWVRFEGLSSSMILSAFLIQKKIQNSPNFDHGETQSVKKFVLMIEKGSEFKCWI